MNTATTVFLTLSQLKQKKRRKKKEKSMGENRIKGIKAPMFHLRGGGGGGGGEEGEKNDKKEKIRINKRRKR